MLRNKTILACVVCLLAAGLTSRTLSQAGGGYGAGGGFRRLPADSAPPATMPKPAKTKLSDEDRHAALKGVAGATDEQWTVIKPKLEKVWQSRQTVGIGIMIFGGSSSSNSSGYSSQSSGKAAGGGGGGGGGGGIGRPGADGSVGTNKPQEGVEVAWRWWPSWGRIPPQKPDEKVCADLFNLLKDKNAKSEDLKQMVDQLRKAREQKAQELAQARKELRDGLTLDQEARMVALGWLD